MRKTILTGFIIGILSLIAIVPVAIGASGDLIWTQASNPSSYDDYASAVAVDSTGVYVVGDDSYPGSTNTRWRMEKRNLTTGSVIWTQTSNPSSYVDSASAVAVDGTGVYIVGYDSYPGSGNARWRIEKRSLTDGSVIWVKASNPSSYWDVATGVAVDSTGVYIVGSDKYADPSGRWRMEKRSLTDGSVIWTQASNPSIYRDEAYGVAVDGSGVYIVGYDNYFGCNFFGFCNSRWRMEKRSLTTGSKIWTNTSNASGYEDNAFGVAVDDTGVYTVGLDSYPGYGDARWRMEKRNLTTGNSIWTKTSNASTSWDETTAITVGGAVYSVGSDSYPGDDRWRMEKRSILSGTSLWTKTSNPSSSYDEAYGVAVDGSGVYIVGVDDYPGNGRWRIEKRVP